MKVCMWEGVWKSGMCVCGEWGIECMVCGVHVEGWGVCGRGCSTCGERGGGGGVHVCA